MIAEWSTLIYNMLTNDVFGDLYLMGACIVIAFAYFGFKKGMSFGAFGVSLIALLFFLIIFGMIPLWVEIIIIIILGAIIGLGINSVVRK